ncbi:hypothetical protein AAVH_20901 [Aphelenchoides avenae]|nr:hypothetical protein AAVH_20901 [Aphelenchus avenae]
MESHMGRAHFATTLADELRRVGITPGPAYDGLNHEEEDGAEPEPALEALELEVNIMEMADQAQSWNGVSKFGGTGEMPFSQWIVKLEDYFDLEKTALTSVQKIARVKFLLEGNARAYFNELQEDPASTEADKKNYGLIKNALAQKFTAKAAKSLANLKLSVAQQRAGLNPAIRIMVKKEEPADFDAAVDWAQRLESLLEEEARLREPQRSVPFSILRALLTVES